MSPRGYRAVAATLFAIYSWPASGIAEPLWVASSPSGKVGGPSAIYAASKEDAGVTLLGETTPNSLDITGMDFGAADLWIATSGFLYRTDVNGFEAEVFATLGGQAIGLAAAVTPDGSAVLGMQFDLFSGLSNILAFDVLSGKSISSVELEQSVRTIDFGVDGGLVGIGSDNESVWSIDLDSGSTALLAELAGLEGTVTDMTLSSRGGFLNTQDGPVGRLYSLDPMTFETNLIGKYSEDFIGAVSFVPPPCSGVVLGLLAWRAQRRTR